MNIFLFTRKAYQGLEYVYSIADFSALFYIAFFTIIFFIIGATKYHGQKKLYRHFIACYFLKLIGCLAFIFIYTYYYDGGDTFRYFRNSKPIIDMADYNPATFAEVIGRTSIEDIRNDYPDFWSNFKEGHQFDMQSDKSTYLVVRFVAIFGLITFSSYISISLFFAAFSSIGVWVLYRTFTRIFPGHENALAIPIIYLPSLFFWGSPIMKDTLVMAFLGFLTYSIYKLFIQKSNIVSSFFLLILSAYCLFTTKEYVILSYIPAILIWVILSISNRMPRWITMLLQPIFVVIAVGVIVLLAPKVGEISQKYAIEQVLQTAELTGSYIYRISQEQDGSAYSLGEVSYTPQGLVSLFPKAVAVTLYRPFPFEVKNLIMLASSMESTLVLMFTIFVLFRVGIFNYVQSFITHPFLIAAIVFSLFFAFAVGASTFNFGSLARYKTPCLPFYGVALIYPYSVYRLKKKEKKLASKNITA